MRFEGLGLHEPLLRAIRTAGYTNTTPIQAVAIPHVLDGKDVLGCAQTGTGKTAAFALPILQRLCRGTSRRNRRARHVRSLVLAPTRELAQQIHDSFSTYGRHMANRTAAIFGGVNQKPQVRAIKDGVDVLVATPGRLLDLIGQGLVSLDKIEILVLDEADRMLDMGFLPDIRRILALVPAERQTLMFSATMPAPIRELAQDMLNEPARIQVAPRHSAPAPMVDHWVYHVEKPSKTDLLTKFLGDTPYSRVLVFTRTKHGADKVSRQLNRAGLDSAALHGNKSQAARIRALEGFRSAKTPILVATDIAARGLDIQDISHVVNYDLTHEPETYIHRIGRTGRAGECGVAVSFCTNSDRGNLRAIEKLLRIELGKAPDPPGYTSPPPTTEERRPRGSNGAPKTPRPNDKPPMSGGRRTGGGKSRRRTPGAGTSATAQKRRPRSKSGRRRLRQATSTR